jgi:hypothetical protein
MGLFDSSSDDEGDEDAALFTVAAAGGGASGLFETPIKASALFAGPSGEEEEEEDGIFAFATTAATAAAATSSRPGDSGVGVGLFGSEDSEDDETGLSLFATQAGTTYTDDDPQPEEREDPGVPANQEPPCDDGADTKPLVAATAAASPGASPKPKRKRPKRHKSKRHWLDASDSDDSLEAAEQIERAREPEPEPEPKAEPQPEPQPRLVTVPQPEFLPEPQTELGRASAGGSSLVETARPALAETALVSLKESPSLFDSSSDEDEAATVAFPESRQPQSQPVPDRSVPVNPLPMSQRSAGKPRHTSAKQSSLFDSSSDEEGVATVTLLGKRPPQTASGVATQSPQPAGAENAEPPATTAWADDSDDDFLSAPDMVQSTGASAADDTVDRLEASMDSLPLALRKEVWVRKTVALNWQNSLAQLKHAPRDRCLRSCSVSWTRSPPIIQRQQLRGMLDWSRGRRTS